MKQIVTNEKYTVENDFIVFNRKFKKLDALSLEFIAEVQIKKDLNNEKYFSYGVLLYAKPIEAIELKGKSYFTNFNDLTYKPINNDRFQFIQDNQATYNDGVISIKAKNTITNQIENITLIPFGKTILRQVSF